MSKPPYSRLLVPTDFSACAEEAWASAQKLARALGAKLTLLHVVMEPAFYSGAPFARGLGGEAQAAEHESAEAQLGRWAEAAGKAGLEVDVEQRVGDASEQILNAARERRADLIVLGTHGGLKRAVLGGVADRVIRHAPCPVVTVHEPG